MKTKYTVTIEGNRDPAYKTWTVILSRQTASGSREESDFNENHLRTALLQMIRAIEEDEHLK